MTDIAALPSFSSPELTVQQKVQIHFKIKERGVWKPDDNLWVNPTDPIDLRRKVVKYMRKRIHIYDKNERRLKIDTCYDDAIADGENTLYLIPEWEEGYVDSTMSGSPFDTQPNVPSNADTEQGEDIEPERKMNRATTASLIRVDNDSVELKYLKNKLSAKRNIVIITGAGISTNAGGKILHRRPFTVSN